MSEMVEGFVTTIIPVYNRPDMLTRSVESVLAQTYRPIELIIVDDGSTDETPKVGEELAKSQPDIIQFTRKENSGPGPTRETGRQLAKGEFIQYLDSDDLLWPNKFEHQVRVLREQPECGVAYGYTRRVISGQEPETKPGKWTGKDIGELFPGLLVDRWWYTHTPLYRRSVCDAVGSWSDLRWSQDWEYDARMGAMNVKLVNCHEFVSDHVEHAGTRQTSEANWKSPKRLQNRVLLLNALLENAIEAGISEQAEERQHFARWAFAIARQCASAGLKTEMFQCLDLAERSAGEDGNGQAGIAMFRKLTAIFGTRCTGLMTEWLKSIRKQPGQNTLVMASAEKS